jgi:hypothetical protein
MALEFRQGLYAGTSTLLVSIYEVCKYVNAVHMLHKDVPYALAYLTGLHVNLLHISEMSVEILKDKFESFHL